MEIEMTWRLTVFKFYIASKETALQQIATAEQLINLISDYCASQK